MPTYDYRCTYCGKQCELNQSMSASPPECPGCGNGMERWFSAAPAVHGGAAYGRERAVRSLPQCGKGCRCCP